MTLAALVGVGFRAVDDAFLQRPQASGSATTSWRARAGAGSGGGRVGRHPPERGACAGWCFSSPGMLGLVGGMELFVEAGPVSGGVQTDDLSGILSLAGGVVLVVVSFHSIWTAPRRQQSVAARIAARGVATLGVWVVSHRRRLPGGPGVLRHPRERTRPHHRPRPRRARDQGRPRVQRRPRLTAWYAPSRNGAAVIVVPGKSGVDHARLLAQHGYGVLLLNRRGEADSEGDPNLFGWGGQGDIDGAIEFLAARDDVRPGRVGALGLSVGGEVLLEHAATSSGLAAVVSEGAGSRSIRETLELSGGIRLAELTTAPLLTGSLVVWSDRAPPPNLVDALRGWRRPPRSSSGARRVSRPRSSSAGRTPRPPARRRRRGRCRAPATPAGSTPPRRTTSASSSAFSTRISWDG